MTYSPIGINLVDKLNGENEIKEDEHDNNNDYNNNNNNNIRDLNLSFVKPSSIHVLSGLATAV